MESGKKISFGFNKSSKKPSIIFNKPMEHNAVELVDCLEEQSIKIKGAKCELVNSPLIIPIKDNQKNLLDKVKEAQSKHTKLINEGNTKPEDYTKPDSELAIEELAVRELIKDARNRLSSKMPNKIFVLPIKDAMVTLDGENEPTLDDYEDVPVSDYGMAMLRGMGWKEGMGIGKNQTRSALTNEPELRPKGLGLGANRMVKAELSSEIPCDEVGNALILKRGTYAKIIAGTRKGNYCEVQGLDEEAGRVIVRTSLKNEILTLNEFLIVPVTNEEYSLGSKILNNAKYEEFKEISDKKLENHWKKDTIDRHEKEVTKGDSSSRHFKENQSVQNEEKPSRPSNYKKGHVTSKDANRRHSSKRYDSKNEKYEKIDKYENRCKYNHTEKNKYSPNSNNGSEKKSRDNNRKSRYHGKSSRSQEDRYKSDKKSLRNTHKGGSSSSNDDEMQMSRRIEISEHYKHDSSEREKASKKT